MAVIAFVYADIKTSRLRNVYAPLADGLVENIQSVMPGVKIIHLTDEDTPAVKGCDILRIKRKVPPMSWRLIVQSLAHAVEDEILFTEPDVRFNENVLDVFEKDFDVTVADREERAVFRGREVLPITLGANFSRSGQFWTDCAKHCLTLERKEQIWGGDITSVSHVMPRYNVLTLPAESYNHVPKTREDRSGKMLHYKGNRKSWLFPEMKEAA